MPVTVGQMAPEFELDNQDKAKIRLADFRGKSNVVLMFYPLDFSPVCSNEHVCMVNDFPQFNATETVVLGISVDSTWCHKSFREAPAFLTIYTATIVIGAGIAMFPGAPLVLITNLPNIINGMLLPLLLPLLILLANDKRIMGRYANSPLFNVFSGAVMVFLTAVTLAFLASIFVPGLFGGR